MEKSSIPEQNKENVKELEKLFRKHVGDGKEIRKEDFKKITHTKFHFFTDRVFDIFDKDGSGSISLDEFLDAVQRFAGKEPDDKIRFLFQVYDVDGDGAIQFEELGQVMRACMEENGMKFTEDDIHKLTRVLFEDADVEKRGALKFEALKAQLQKHNGLLESLASSMEGWLIPPKPKPRNWKTRLSALVPHQCSIRYITNNFVYLAWLLIFILTNIGLFISRIIVYSNENIYLAIARGAGQCLNFNCTMAVVVMLRQSLTFLRARGASAFLPIDQHIYFHQMFAWLIFFFGYLHTIMHLLNIEFGMLQETNNDCRQIVNETTCPTIPQNKTYLTILFDPTATTNLGLIPGYAYITGVALIILLTTMVVCSLPFVRRGGCFEIFYWTHLSYFAFWGLLIIHAPKFWMWFVVPGVIYIIEQALRSYRLKIDIGKASIISGNLLGSKVTHLVIRRPVDFEFRPGDYVFVKIPQIATYEWHPFTISSAPERGNELWLHIRAEGQWTNKLYDYFKKIEQKKLNHEKGIEVAGVGIQLNLLAKFTPKILRKQKYEVHQISQEEKHDVHSGFDKSQEIDFIDSKLSEVRQGSPTNGESSKGALVSVDSINETEAIVNKCTSSQHNKPKSTPTKSPQNFNEKIPDGEGKMSVPNKGKISRVPNKKSTPSALKILRRKGQRKDNRQSDCPDRKAEEGRSIKCEDEDLSDGELNELHPMMGTQRKRPENLVIYLDGPYGAPSSHIFQVEHAVLIATEIGVTPFASILQSLSSVLSKRNKLSCSNCNFLWQEDMPEKMKKSTLILKKVDFFWINRHQKSFEWFVKLLTELEIKQAEQIKNGAIDRFLDMHMYITSAHQRNDMKAVGIQLALDLLHEKENRDLITGLKTRTNAGRPDWNTIFQQLREQRKGKVTVFFCGSPALAKILKVKCDEFDFSFRKEVF